MRAPMRVYSQTRQRKLTVERVSRDDTSAVRMQHRRASARLKHERERVARQVLGRAAVDRDRALECCGVGAVRRHAHVQAGACRGRSSREPQQPLYPTGIWAPC